MSEKVMLLASFINRVDIDDTVEKIKKYFLINTEDKTNPFKIFLLKNVDDETKVILTYNVVLDDTKILQYNKNIPGTINLHRKKETNTLFTINALNSIVSLETDDNQKNKEHIIQWENYKNCILITQNGIGFLKVRTELEKILR